MCGKDELATKERGRKVFTSGRRGNTFLGGWGVNKAMQSLPMYYWFSDVQVLYQLCVLLLVVTEK